MARGWESKAVEAQQEEAADNQSPRTPRLTPEAASRFRQRESLRLSLRRVLQQLDNNLSARHREMLENARTELELKIMELAR